MMCVFQQQKIVMVPQRSRYGTVLSISSILSGVVTPKSVVDIGNPHYPRVAWVGKILLFAHTCATYV